MPWFSNASAEHCLLRPSKLDDCGQMFRQSVRLSLSESRNPVLLFLWIKTFSRTSGNEFMRFWVVWVLTNCKTRIVHLMPPAQPGQLAKTTWNWHDRHLQKLATHEMGRKLLPFLLKKIGKLFSMAIASGMHGTASPHWAISTVLWWVYRLQRLRWWCHQVRAGNSNAGTAWGTLGRPAVRNCAFIQLEQQGCVLDNGCWYEFDAFLA